jgi:hypothetical protein
MLNQTTINGETIIAGHNGVALVASKSQPGGWHVVRPVKGILCCDCKAAEHGRSCRHVRAVEALNVPKVEPAVEPAPVPPAREQNELVWVGRNTDPLFLPERPAQPKREPRSFEAIFGFSPNAA